MAEYGLISLEVNINPDASTENLARDFALASQRMMQNLNEGIAKMPDGPWEIVSHDFVQVGYKLLGTFLTRKT